jgi:hypothetical protein
MKTIKKINPGMKGTKNLVERYGDNLVCVRYRNDYERQRKIKTIELIIDERPLSNNPSKIPMNKIMQLKVKYGEVDVGRLIKSAGGRWDRKQSVWELPYQQVLALGLEDRIVNKGEKIV